MLDWSPATMYFSNHPIIVIIFLVLKVFEFEEISTEDIVGIEVEKNSITIPSSILKGHKIGNCSVIFIIINFVVNN